MPTSGGPSTDAQAAKTPPLRCPVCGDELSPVLEYTGVAHSEHRDFTGYECDNYRCGAAWDARGNVTREAV
jgi:hypothetical protein